MRLVVVGAGPREDALRTLAADLGLPDRVVLTGGRADVARLLAAFDIFASSSRQEASPLAVIEAMHAGLPVVATACGAVPDLVTDREDGHLVPVGDDAALADRLASLIGERDTRAALGAHARAHAQAELSVEVMARR